MDLLQASQAPIVAEYGSNATLAIPKFEMDDIIAMGARIMAERVAAQTQGMTDDQVTQFKQFYPPLPPDMQEIKRYVRTPEGMRDVCSVCLPRAILSRKGGTPSEDRPLTSDEIAKILKYSPSKLGPLAWALADMEEVMLAAPKKVDAKDQTGSQEGNR